MILEALYRGRNARAVAVVGGLLAGAASASAQSFAEIEFWIGSGSNEAAFVIDWNDGITDESLMWGYRWDGEATGEDMLHAIVTADNRLFAHVSTPYGDGLGAALYGLGYDIDDDRDFGVTPALAFDDGGYSIGDPVDGRSPSDTNDHWQEGWFTDGYWSYWLGGEDGTPDWGFSDVGMSSRILSNGSWDGWSYAPGFSGGAPSRPIPAEVPAPGVASLLALGGLAWSRRRRSAMVALATVGSIAGSAAADYVYDPNDFAVEVVDSVGYPDIPGLYTDPAAILGGPATMFHNIFPEEDRRVKLIEPAYNTSPTGEHLITTFNPGQSVTVRMGRTVYDDPNNPYGVDLNVFGNAFFAITSGGFVDDDTDLGAVTVGGVFAENVAVSVSPDNSTWYTYNMTGDGIFPTNAYLWDTGNATWLDELADPTKPVDPSLVGMDFSGMTAEDVLAYYDGATGGVGFDLAESGFSFINYVRFEGLSDFSGGEIDAVAAIRAVPTPGALMTMGWGAFVGVRRRR